MQALWRGILESGTPHVDCAKYKSINKVARYTAATVDDADKVGNPFYVFESVTDYVECRYTAEFNLNGTQYPRTFMSAS